MSDRPKRATISEHIGSNLGALFCPYTFGYLYTIFSPKFIFCHNYPLRSVNWYSQILISDGQSNSLDTGIVAHTILTRSTHVLYSLHGYLQSYTIIFSLLILFFFISICLRCPLRNVRMLQM